jgi:hypothetical protein
MADNPWAELYGKAFGDASGNDSNNGLLGTLNNLWQNTQTGNNADAIYGQVQANNQAQQGAILSQIQAMQQQAAKQRQDAQNQYNTSRDQFATANQGLQGNISTMTNNLNALSDPNSAYMQSARQAIERKDASAGRRSQWGERETQLAGMLANNVSQYAPGINNSITAAQDEINKNNTSLSSIYDNMNRSGALTDTNLTSLINYMNQAAANYNTTGAQAMQRATNAQAATNNSALNAAGNAAGGLGSLLSGLFGGGSQGITGYSGAYGDQSTGITGLSGNYGDQGYGSIGDYNAFGNTNLASGLSNGSNLYGFQSGLSTMGGGDSGWGSYSGGGNYNGYTTGNGYEDNNFGNWGAG